MIAVRRWPACLLFVLLTFSPQLAAAFHTGATFGERAVDGGGGGIFYVGMPLERGWDCTMCHTDPPGRMKIRVTVDPPALFESFRYEVAGEYAFTVDLVWDAGVSELGLASTRSNFNGLAVGVADADGIFAGSLQGGGFVGGSGAGTIASEGLVNAQTRFAFRWFAPTDSGRGTVKLFLGAVDGNGANSPSDVTRTDPLGDDVFMAQVTLEEETGAATRLVPTPRTRVPVPPAEQLRHARVGNNGHRDDSLRARAPQTAVSQATPRRGVAFVALFFLVVVGWRRQRSAHTRFRNLS